MVKRKLVLGARDEAAKKDVWKHTKRGKKVKRSVSEQKEGK